MATDKFIAESGTNTRRSGFRRVIFKGKSTSYLVTPEGSVFSEKTNRVLKGTPNHAGYLYVSISWVSNRGFVSCNVFVHKLVATAFLGPKPKGLSTNHKNGVKSDNRPENLEYLSHQENCLHASRFRLRKPLRGEDTPRAKLTNAQAMLMRRIYAVGKTTIAQLARDFKCNPGTAWSCVKGASYLIDPDYAFLPSKRVAYGGQHRPSRHRDLPGGSPLLSFSQEVRKGEEAK